MLTDEDRKELFESDKYDWKQMEKDAWDRLFKSKKVDLSSETFLIDGMNVKDFIVKVIKDQSDYGLQLQKLLGGKNGNS
jgi:hypothetical protein